MPRDHAGNVADQQAVRELADALFVTADRKDWDYSTLTRGNDAVRTHPA